ncbi:hypothetical protein CDD80_2235 [Ophiocordyceps camponoti-rufipedis]|uniref:Xylanolytic transcriptional activator regulatory domain-containing protein n=1 Tax=Ophiocordyceps camponoti-rufipedis TaxID=2004952 RepID=A0A2C5Z6W2_9HYPO|nr:hypothetical protein CDD80_2235 [Ophiocordyceps camponoti-rufipedis]
MLSVDPFEHHATPPGGECTSSSITAHDYAAQAHFPTWTTTPPPFSHLPVGGVYPVQQFDDGALPQHVAKQGRSSSGNFKLDCEYMREKKKRGKASRKELAERAAAAAAASAAAAAITAVDHTHEPRRPPTLSLDGSECATSLASDDSEDGSDRPLVTDPMPQQLHMADVSQQADVSGYGAISVDCCEQGLPLGSPQAYADPGLGLGHVPQRPQGSAFAVRGTSLGAYPMAAMASSGWGINMSPSLSPSPGYVPSYAHLRYPVLGPLVPQLESALLPFSLACDLLDFYFSSSSTVGAHPLSPYVLGFVFRRRSFLHSTRPRRCQPALLASMLWVAAQTSDAALLTSSPAARAVVCQRLLDLTLRLLKPLVHAPLSQTCLTSDTSVAAAHPLDGGLGSMDTLTAECAALGAAGQLDDVATYMHIATVASASEYKGASLRWWNTAWSLARELKLGRELSPSVPIKDELDGSRPRGICRSHMPDLEAEEEREERRRLWWLLYIVDRHLALCFNRPLFLLDIECDGLLLPMDDAAWQTGNFPVHQETAGKVGALEAWPNESRFECRGHGIFGFFLPLMTILGEVVDLHHAQNHPSCGRGMGASGNWEARAEEIRRHIDLYEQSLARLEERCSCGIQLNSTSRMGNASSRSSSPSNCSIHRGTQDEMQTRTIKAYGTHATHVLHILLASRWDPSGVIDDSDTWLSSGAFFKAASHTVSAADAVGQILEYDPGLELMPFFFGIYLMQGSVLLPLVADELRLEASSSVVRACETIVRAHEACIVTLSSECQRNFSRVMRSALSVARGRVVDECPEQRQRWRQEMGPFRWAGDDTGLAL